MKYVKKAGYIVATIFFFGLKIGPFVLKFVYANNPKTRNVTK